MNKVIEVFIATWKPWSDVDREFGMVRVNEDEAWQDSEDKSDLGGRAYVVKGHIDEITAYKLYGLLRQEREQEKEKGAGNGI
jgi:hypothetical protein